MLLDSKSFGLRDLPPVVQNPKPRNPEESQKSLLRAVGCTQRGSYSAKGHVSAF